MINPANFIRQINCSLIQQYLISPQTKQTPMVLLESLFNRPRIPLFEAMHHG